MLEDNMPAAPNATAVERALSVLEYLDSSRRGLRISEISGKVDMPKSSAHVIVLTLQRLGYVQKRDDTLNYTLGFKAYALGKGMTKNLSISEVALPHMRALVDRLKLPAHLAVPDNDQGVFIQKVEAPGLIKFDTYIGRRMDLHCTGVGKVILPFGPPHLPDRLLEKPLYVHYTKNTITSPRALRRENARVRQAGHAIDDEEEELAVRCVAVPVFRPNGRFAAGLSVTGTISQVLMTELEGIAEQLKQTAAAIFPPESTADMA